MLYFSVLWMLKYSIRWRPPMLGLRCSCQDCGAHAKIVVLMPRLWCSCQDWGAHAEIEVLKSPQSWPEHRNLGMSTSNSAWAPQSKHSNYLCIWGRHHQLDYLALWDWISMIEESFWSGRSGRIRVERTSRGGRWSLQWGPSTQWERWGIKKAVKNIALEYYKENISLGGICPSQLTLKTLTLV